MQEINGHHLMQDLADTLDFNALDKAIIVLVEWGIVEADLASSFINEMVGK